MKREKGKGKSKGKGKVRSSKVVVSLAPVGCCCFPLLLFRLGGGAISLSPSLTRYNARCSTRSCHRARHPHRECWRTRETNNKQHVRTGSVHDLRREITGNRSAQEVSTTMEEKDNRQHARTGSVDDHGGKITGVDDHGGKITGNTSAQEVRTGNIDDLRTNFKN